MGVAYQRGTLLYDRRRYAPAADEFRKELAENPGNAMALAMLALALTYDGRPAEGFARAQEAVAADPDRAFVHYALSCVIVGQGRNRKSESKPRPIRKDAEESELRLKQARMSAQEAVRLEPENPDFLALMAAIELDLKHDRTALQWADRGLMARPDHVRCANLRAKALARLGRVVEARQTIDRALAVNPEHAATHATSGWTRLRAGDTKQAIEHFTESVRLNPTDANALRGLQLSRKLRNPLRRIFLGRAAALWLYLVVIFALVRIWTTPSFNHDMPVGLLIVSTAALVAIRIRRWRIRRR